jgi:hypothetical protein
VGESKHGPLVGPVVGSGVGAVVGSGVCALVGSGVGAGVGSVVGTEELGAEVVVGAVEDGGEDGDGDGSGTVGRGSIVGVVKFFLMDTSKHDQYITPVESSHDHRNEYSPSVASGTTKLCTHGTATPAKPVFAPCAFMLSPQTPSANGAVAIGLVVVPRSRVVAMVCPSARHQMVTLVPVARSLRTMWPLEV